MTYGEHTRLGPLHTPIRYEASSLVIPKSAKRLIIDIELLNLVRHMQAYPSDTLEAALRNVFDFDVYRPETISKLEDILDHHGCAFVSVMGCVVSNVKV